MELEVYLYASLAKYLPQKTSGKSVRVNAESGSTARDVLKKLGVSEKVVKIAFVNGVKKDLDAAVSNGDRVGFFPPVGGG
ncbi:MAG: MoaD/ThiS family protein [Desulfobacterales bacterium]